MVYETKPGAHFSDVCRCWEVTYCIKVFLALLDVGGGDFEACKFNSASPKYKFVGVENDAIVATDVKPLNCLEEALGEIVCPEKRVVSAFGLVRDMRDNLIIIFWSSHHLMQCTPGVLFCVGIAPMR